MTATHRNNSRTGLDLIRGLLIASVAVWIYSPAFRGDWIWDDSVLITANSSLHSLRGLWDIWFATPATDYWPLTWTALWIEWHLWGNAPLGYHLVSLAGHILSALLIWRIFRRLGLRCAWLGGLLFAIHPLAVESVAWMSEIKNTISLPLFLLSFDAWLDFEEKKPAAYPRSIFYYLLAMLGKTSTVMLPAILLLYCWWRRGRVTRQETLRVLPYAAIALVLGTVTIYFQHRGQEIHPVELGGLGARLAAASSALFLYLGKFVLPANLVPIYPRWDVNAYSVLSGLASLLVFAALLVGLWMKRETWGRHALFGLGFFVLNLLPVLGLLKMEYLDVSPVADHLVYLPMIGLIGLLCAGYGQLTGPGAGARGATVAIATVALTLLAWKSHDYTALFSNQEMFWRYVTRHNPNSPLARNNLAYCLVQEGKISDAKDEYEAALRIDPQWFEARYNLGVLLLGTGNLPEAEADFRKVLQADPDHANAHGRLAQIMARTGRNTEAIAEYDTAVRLAPDDAERRSALGDLLLQAHSYPAAVEQYEQSLRLDPHQATVEYNLGNALAQSGQESEALDHYRQAVQIDPNFADSRFNLGNALAHAGQVPQAVEQYEEALRINPRYGEAHANLGTALLQLGQTAEAIDQYQQALQIVPGDLNVRNALGFALGRSGRFAEAQAQFETVLKSDPQNVLAKAYLEKLKSVPPPAP